VGGVHEHLGDDAQLDTARHDPGAEQLGDRVVLDAVVEVGARRQDDGSVQGDDGLTRVDPFEARERPGVGPAGARQRYRPRLAARGKLHEEALPPGQVRKTVRKQIEVELTFEPVRPAHRAAGPQAESHDGP
jgi:hypothetical protein